MRDKNRNAQLNMDRWQERSGNGRAYSETGSAGRGYSDTGSVGRGSTGGRKYRRVMIVIDIFCAVLAVGAAILLIRQAVNENFISKYNAGTFDRSIEEPITKVGFPEEYVAYYNCGNAAYRNGDFDQAIADYEKALEAGPRGTKECPVRINLALSIIQKIDFDHLDTDKQKKSAINQLLAARQILTANGCADPADANGHSENAEKLKKDIDEMLKELGYEPPESEEQDPENQQSDRNRNNNSGSSNREQNVRNELNDRKDESMGERSEEQQQAEQGGNPLGGDEDGGGEDGGSAYYSGEYW